ncbi:MAG: SH3 domain-containing protein, partial [Desulfobacteraceae bacterium]
MKRIMLLILFLVPALCLAGERVQVKVQKASVFNQPNFFSKAVATLQFGDQLEMEEVVKDWAKVKFGQQRGYIHQSAL